MKLMPLALLAVCMPALSDAQQNVLIRYKFTKGATYRYTMGMAMNAKTEMTGAASGSGSMPMKMMMKTGYTQTVKSVAGDGTATLLMKLGKQNMTMNGKAFPVAMPKIPPMTVQMSPTGHVDFDGKALSGLGPGASAFQGMQMSNFLPDGPVHVGSKWSTTFKMGAAGSEMTVVSVLEKVTQSGGSQIARLRLKGSIDPAAFGKMFAGAGGAASGLKMSGNVSYNFVVLFDVTHGWIQSQKGNATYDMHMSMNNPQEKKPMKMHMAGTQTITLAKS